MTRLGRHTAIIAAQAKRIEEAEKVMQKSERVLMHFACRVFNDNGEMTISGPGSEVNIAEAAYFANAAARAWKEKIR